MEKASITIKMDRFMTGNGLKTSDAVKEKFCFKMGPSMMANGKQTKCTERVSLFPRMEIDMKATLIWV